MLSFFSKKNTISTEKLVYCVEKFDHEGELFGDGKRNKIKLFSVENQLINIKSFKNPNFLNKIVYRYFRKSKARRSFEYATVLLEKGIGTPKPIAYFENYDLMGLKDSYYISEHLNCDLTYRDLVEIPEIDDHENILRQFSRFCYDLHQKGIEFKDHSPGNTLISKNSNGAYDFYLVDLNRMSFHSKMSFELRMKNMCRLTPKLEMIKIMSDEYAKASGENPNDVFDALWQFTSDFQKKYHRKKHLKAKYLKKK